MSAAIIEVPNSCFQCNHRLPSNGHVPDSCYVFLQNCFGGIPCEACRGARKAAEGANLHPPTKQSTPLVQFCDDCGRELDLVCAHCNDAAW